MNQSAAIVFSLRFPSPGDAIRRRVHGKGIEKKRRALYRRASFEKSFTSLLVTVFVSLAFGVFGVFGSSFRLSHVTSRCLVSEAIPSEIHVDCGVRTPIGMEAFVFVETRHSNVVARNPDVAGSQVDIPATHETNVFNAVPNVTVRDEDYSGFGRYDNGCWSNDYGRRRRLGSDHYRRRRYGDDRWSDYNPARFDHTP